MKRFLNFRSGLIFILGVAVLLVIADLAMLYNSPRLRKDMDLKVVDSAIFVHSEIADFESASLPVDKRTPWMDLQVPEPAPEKYTVEQGILTPEPEFSSLPTPAPLPEPVKEPEPEPEPVVQMPEPEPVIRHEGEPAKIVIIIQVPAGYAGPGELYALTVEGDSMINAGIHDGDTVIIKRCDSAENGVIVVALVDGEEATLKRLRRAGNKIVLEPENDTYEPQILEPNRVKIQGRLVSLMRSYH